MPFVSIILTYMKILMKISLCAQHRGLFNSRLFFQEWRRFKYLGCLTNFFNHNFLGITSLGIWLLDFCYWPIAKAVFLPFIDPFQVLSHSCTCSLNELKHLNFHHQQLLKTCCKPSYNFFKPVLECHLGKQSLSLQKRLNF